MTLLGGNNYILKEVIITKIVLINTGRKPESEDVGTGSHTIIMV